MKNLFKITDAKLVIGLFAIAIVIFVTVSILHPGGNPPKYSDYSNSTVYPGWSSEALTK